MVSQEKQAVRAEATLGSALRGWQVNEVLSGALNIRSQHGLRYGVKYSSPVFRVLHLCFILNYNQFCLNKH